MNDRYNSMLQRLDVLEAELHWLDVLRASVADELAGCEKQLDAITAPVASTAMRLCESPSISERKKGGWAMLIVEFAGRMIDHRIAARTFVEVLKMIGLHRIRSLGLQVRGVPLVSRKRHDVYQQWPADGWLIITHSATEEKKRNPST